MSTTALPQHINDKLQALRDARAAHDKNYQALTDVITGIARCHQQKKDTEVESHEAEGQWRTLFRKLSGEMTPELQAQHHNRISKRELTKEFDGLIEEMEMDKIQFHLNCGGTAPKLKDAHRPAMLAFGDHAMDKAVEAIQVAVINDDVIKACTVAKQAYGVYRSFPMEVIEKRLMSVVSLLMTTHMMLNTAKQPVLSPVLDEIGLIPPDAPGVSEKLQNSPAYRTQVVKELAEKRQRLQLKGAKS
ncbi:NAD-dependent aldehyde dehydrogenase [Serratia liquefaciens]|uniref:NAD-dependent aldehyde dehydrogenase n=1 Tax=Serratia liquefaciens TaxID=614 RepID=UPI000D50EC0D|nr:NAD-dependent aldehyde dehydrogenase [Serratia liquefaciens]PVD45719.1 NAD-dependent aldehyde dehydrogenase [Serratia liquefaciens]QHT52349.1 NAD-dependent aldehyde dehydrogenase [Serratia liquefaciens]